MKVEWKDDESNLEEVVSKSITHAWRVKPECCENPSVHIYAHRHNGKERGGGWAWCNSCGAFVHLDGVRLHKNWENCEGLDFQRMCAIPEYLNDNCAIVDRHFDLFMRRNNFVDTDELFLKGYTDCPACGRGTIVPSFPNSKYDFECDYCKEKLHLVPNIVIE